MRTGRVEAVTLLEHIEDGLDYIQVQIDFDIHPMFGDYYKVLSLLNKDVEYSVRPDLYKGQKITAIANIADIYTIQTVAQEENIKLIPVCERERAVCNFDISALDFGDSQRGCIGFLADYTKGSSDVATWVDLKVIDQKSRCFILKRFTTNYKPENGLTVDDIVSGMVGHYIKFNIRRTKYGYQTDEEDLELMNIPVLVPPEVEIAEKEILKAVADDKELQEYLSMYDFIPTLKKLIFYEMGYHLVHIASEIYMIKALSNISTEYNAKTLIRAAICSRAYLLPSKGEYSRSLLNTNKMLRSSLKSDMELAYILDALSEAEATPTKKAYIQVATFVNKILSERRGINEETVDNVDLPYLRYKFGGLL